MLHTKRIRQIDKKCPSFTYCISMNQYIHIYKHHNTLYKPDFQAHNHILPLINLASLSRPDHNIDEHFPEPHG